MKKNIASFTGSLFLSFLIFLTNTNQSQAQFFKDCGIYGEIYDGITCRTASTQDIPICEENEEIVSSPRRSKLCCCSRLNEEEVSNGSKEANCPDIGCKNLTKEGKCPKGLELSEPPSDEGPVICCCPPEKVFVSKCKPVGCTDFVEKCPVDSPKTLVLSTTTPEEDFIFTGSGFGCCCKDGVMNIEAITCKMIFNFCQDVSENGSTCPTGSKLKNYGIDVGRDGSAERTIDCCCTPSGKPGSSGGFIGPGTGAPK
jgi:hypothetical protein